jgi:hypothetical protein
MTVSAVNGSSSLWPAQAQKPPTPPAMTDTAQLFGLSTTQLSQDMQSGTTLSSLASQDGVSSSSLISAVESDLQANAPQGAPALSSDQLTQMATNIANGTGPAGHPHGGHHHAMNLNSTSQLLGLSTTQLSQDMQSGSTLSSLASQDGVSSSSLISAVESDLQANAPQGAPTLSTDQLTQMATNIADGTGPGSGGGQNQGDVSEVGSGQSFASLAAGAYANSATEIAGTAGAGGQVDAYI